MEIGNLLNEKVWAMNPERLAEMRDFYDLRRLIIDQPLAMTNQLSFSSLETESFKTQSGKKVDYALISGTLLPRTFGMKAICGLFPTNHLVNVLEESEGDTLILHLDSGGGSVTGIPEASKAIRSAVDAGKEIIAFTDTMCCSAAYYLASACSIVVASPSSTIGNIGVYATLSKSSGKETKIIKAGEHKAFGHPDLEVTDEEINWIQNNVNSIYDTFCNDVASYRSCSVQDIKGTKADPYRGIDAPSFLVDKIMTLKELLTFAKEQ